MNSFKNSPVIEENAYLLQAGSFVASSGEQGCSEMLVICS
jgi:hypothetical protein